MKSGNKTEELEHPVEVVSVCSNDMKTVITAAEDSSVRVWDRTRKAQKISQSPGISAHRIRWVEYEPCCEKYRLRVSDQVRHKPACLAS